MVVHFSFFVTTVGCVRAHVALGRAELGGGGAVHLMQTFRLVLFGGFALLQSTHFWPQNKAADGMHQPRFYVLCPGHIFFFLSAVSV